MADPIQNLQHVKQGLSQALAQFQGQPNFESLLRSYLVQIQEAEDMFFQLLIERRLDTAVGAQLDGLGSIVSEGRRGRQDEPYRAAIRARIRILRLNSRIEDLILVVTLSLPGSVVRIDELSIAAIEIHVQTPVDLDVGLEVAAVVRAAKAAGVEYRMYWHGSVPRFRYAQGGVEVPASPWGYGNGEYSAVSAG